MSTLGALYGHSSTSNSNRSSTRKGKSSANSTSSNPINDSTIASTSTSNLNFATTTTCTSTSPTRSALPRQNILISGLRRSGKTSILKVVHGRLSPNDTLFLDSTTKSNFKLVDSFNPIRFWDLPGSNLPYSFSEPLSKPNSNGTTTDTEKEKQKEREEAGPPDYHRIHSIIFVIDAQDDYFDSLSTLHETILKVHRVNSKCQFHVFIHKVDGLSDDYKWDTQRDIEQRIFDDLSDASGSFLYSNQKDPDDNNRPSSSRNASNPSYSNELNHSASSSPSNPSQFSQINLETSVPLTFHLTSIFDSSVFIAFSRVQAALVHKVLGEALESVCSSLCNSCTFDKVLLLDVPSRTYVGLDAGPFDAGTFDVASEYVSFLGEMSSLYSNLPSRRPDEIEENQNQKQEEALPPNAFLNQDGNGDDRDEGEDGDEIKNQGRYAASSARLNPDTTVGFWQMNNHLALVATLRTEAYSKQAGLIDYNLTFFRRAVQQLYEMAQFGGDQKGDEKDER